MKRLSRLAFTLIELLVVISIIGILAALAIPAVSGALVKGQMTGTLNNARQLQLATFNVNLENEAAGQPGAWPSSNVNFDQWRTFVTNVLTLSDLQKMLSAPGVSVSNAQTVGMTDTAFNFYQVGNTEESSTVFVSTRNWSAVAPNTIPNATVRPYGDKGVIVMRKGGDGQIFQTRFITNTNTLGLPGGTNPPLVN